MWLATGGLLTVWRRMLVSGAEIAPCLQALAVACLPLCLQWGEGPVHSWLALLWCSLNALFCERARLGIRLESFVGKFSLCFLGVPQFGVLLVPPFLGEPRSREVQELAQGDTMRKRPRQEWNLISLSMAADVLGYLITYAIL